MTSDYPLDADGNYPENHGWETVTVRVSYIPPLPRVIVAPTVAQLTQSREITEDLELERLQLLQSFENLKQILGEYVSPRDILVSSIRQHLIESNGEEYKNAPIRNIEVIDGILPWYQR